VVLQKLQVNFFSCNLYLLPTITTSQLFSKVCISVNPNTKQLTYLLNQTMANQPKIPRPEIKWALVPSAEIGQQLGVSRSTLKNWRKTGVITEGIHWMYRPGTKARVLWNQDLMRDWIANGDSPAHQRSIERYIASLPSSQAA
jgi:hypothetical protein